MGGQDDSLETARVELWDVAAQQDFLTLCERASPLAVHPHLVTIHDHGLSPDGAGYVATDPPPGRSLTEGLSRDGAFALAASLRIGIALAGALQTVHQAGLTHGAVSPGNVFLGPAREPVLANLVRSGAAGGSGDDGRADALDHAPPEVLHGGGATPVADVYALASTVYTMVAGRTPEAARALAAVGSGPTASDPTEALPPIGGKIPVELEDALAKALISEPTVRTQTASAFGEALQEIQRQLHHPVTELVIDVQAPDLTPDGMAYTYAEPPVVPGVVAAEEATAWWRSPAVYLGAGAAAALVAGVVMLLGGGGDSSDGGDEPEGEVPSGENAAGEPDSSGDGAAGGGSDAEPPDEEDSELSDEPQEEPDETEAEPDDGSRADDEPEDRAPPGNLSVLENPVGVQLDWDGEEDGRYVILVSSDAEDSRFVPAPGGPSHLIPADLLLPDAGYCFAVAYLDEATSDPDEAGDDSAFSDPACIRDADAESIATSDGG